MGNCRVHRRRLRCADRRQRVFAVHRAGQGRSQGASGTDRTGGMADAAISIDAFKKTVRFNSGKPDRWTRYREEASGGRQYLFEVRQNG